MEDCAIEELTHHLQHTIRSLARTSAFSKSAAQETSLAALVHVTQQVLAQRFSDLVSSAVRDDDAVLHCYMSDGWS